MGQFSGKWPSSLDNVSKPLITYQRFWYIIEAAGTVIAAIVTCRPKNSMVLWRSNELQIFLFECWIARSERVERIPRVALNGSLNKSRSFCPFLLVRRGYWARKFVLALSTAELQHVIFFIFLVLPSQQDGLLLVSPLKLKNPVHLLKSGQNPTE